jgi:hypothetical protein
MRLVNIEEAGRELVPIVCPLKFVQGYRCNQCPWARLFPECHTPWAVPFCHLLQICRAFEEHQCMAPEAEVLKVLQ